MSAAAPASGSDLSAVMMRPAPAARTGRADLNQWEFIAPAAPAAAVQRKLTLTFPHERSRAGGDHHFQPIAVECLGWHAAALQFGLNSICLQLDAKQHFMPALPGRIAVGHGVAVN